jgi:hypothetical protein
MSATAEESQKATQIELRVVDEDAEAGETVEGECVLKGSQLSILSQNLAELPEIVLTAREVPKGKGTFSYSPLNVQSLDLSYNNFSYEFSA